MYPPSFLFDLAEGHEITRYDGVPCKVKWQPIGELVVPSGVVCIGDPQKDSSMLSLTKRVPKGRFPVTLALAAEQVAYAFVTFKQGAVFTWDVAESAPVGEKSKVEKVTTDSENPKKSEESLLHSESKTVGFLSAEACIKLRQTTENIGPNGPKSSARSVKKSANKEKSLHRVMLLDELTGANMLVFSASDVAGPYRFYWGLDKANNPMCLLVDFKAILEEDALDDESDDGLDDQSLNEMLASLLKKPAPKPSSPPPSKTTAQPDVTEEFVAAKKLLQLLLKNEALELKDGAKLDALAKELIPFLNLVEPPRKRAASMMEHLLDHKDVEEVFISEDELKSILAAW